jgi:hypothetical protein
MTTSCHDRDKRIDRRWLLASACTAAVAAVLPGGVAAATHRATGFANGEDRFGRLFPGLRPFAEPSRKLNEVMLELGRPGGLLDAQDDLAAGPVQLIVDLELSRNNPNNPAHTAGTTFIGQFMDHDLTFDRTDHVPVRGVAGVDRRDAGQGRFGQAARTGGLTAALSPSGAMVSSVM